MPTEIVSLPEPTADESQSMSSVRGQLLDSFKTSKEYRHAFVEEKIRTSVAVQIKAIREQRVLTQPEFAAELGKSQSWVSRLEDPNQPPPTIPSLLTVAEAFDVDLEIRFGRFSELLDRLDKATPESFEVPSFTQEVESGTFEASSAGFWSLDNPHFVSHLTPRIYSPFVDQLHQMYYAIPNIDTDLQIQSVSYLVKTVERQISMDLLYLGGSEVKAA